MESEYKFKEKYNPKSNRLQKYDYSSNGGYFITICTKNRENYFGEIVDGKMILNEIGGIVNDQILNLGNHFCYINIDTFVIMPNHIHFVLILDNNKCRDNDKFRDNNKCRDVSQKHLYENNDQINNIFQIYLLKNELFEI